MILNDFQAQLQYSFAYLLVDTVTYREVYWHSPQTVLDETAEAQPGSTCVSQGIGAVKSLNSYTMAKVNSPSVLISLRY